MAAEGRLLEETSDELVIANLVNDFLSERTPTFVPHYFRPATVAARTACVATVATVGATVLALVRHDFQPRVQNPRLLLLFVSSQNHTSKLLNRSRICYAIEMINK